jgi:hypothetical protein
MGPGVGIFLFVSWEIRGGRFQGHPRVSGGCPLFRRETKEGMPSNPLIPGASSMTHNKPIWSESKLIVEIKKYLCLLHIENSTVSDKVAEPCAGLKLARNIKIPLTWTHPSSNLIQQREAPFVYTNANTDLPRPACHHRCGHPHSNHCHGPDYGPVSETILVQGLGRRDLPAMMAGRSIR